MAGPDQAAAGWRRLADEAAVAELGARIAERLERGEAVCLDGPLGAGKSTLARGLVRALTRPDEDAPSPTFTLMQAYEGRRFPLAHFDLYRLRSAEEAYEAGLDEALDLGAAVIEWSVRLGGAQPPDRLAVRLEIDPPAGAAGEPGGRWVRWEGVGAWRTKARALDQG